jgi:multidrug efflux pump subunit AcrA (membrane-fusion protein)
MAVEILMPALSPTMEEGTLAKWLVKVGDKVKSGQILAEIETDKATMEFEAVEEGIISQLLVAAGIAHRARHVDRREHAHQLAAHPGGRGERSQKVEDGAPADLFARRADMLHRRVIGLREQEDQAGLRQNLFGRIRHQVDIHT